MKRPCAHPFCDEQLAENAPRDKRFHSDNCGRDFRRMKADPEFASLRAGEAFYGKLSDVRRLVPGQALRGGTSRRVHAGAVAT